MSSFTRKLTVTKIGEHTWSIEHAFDYYIDTEDGRVIRVPQGFVTDFASVPRPFWTIFPPSSGDYVQASVLHDYLYEGGPIFEHGIATSCSYKEADKIFLQAMAVLGVPTWQRYTIYAAVRFYSSCIKPLKKRFSK